MDNERPELTPETLKRIKNSGMNPEDLSNKQISAIKEMNDPDMWGSITKILYYISIRLGIIAVISLFITSFKTFLFFGGICILFRYLDYRTQILISSSKFFNDDKFE